MAFAAFLPIFLVIDLITGQNSQFTGSYTLKVVGGGAEFSSVRDYTPEEQQKYNYRELGLDVICVQSFVR